MLYRFHYVSAHLKIQYLARSSFFTSFFFLFNMCFISSSSHINFPISGRADLDRLAKEAQSLWLSCEALACRLHSVSPSMKSHHETKSDSVLLSQTGSLKDFVNSIRECAASGNYPFVNIILDSLSSDIVENGVWTENGLKKRFEKVNFYLFFTVF